MARIVFHEIETKRCRLRAFRESDLPAFAAYRADPGVARFQSWSSYRLEDARALFANLVSKPFGQEGEWYQIALADLATDELIGDVAVHFLGSNEVEVGFTVSPRFQGEGYGKEGLRALLGHLFGGPGIRRAKAITDARNAPSIRALESVGFERVDVRRVTFKGEVVDEYVYSCSPERLSRREGIS